MGGRRHNIKCHTNSITILTGTFFCVTTHTESFPRTPMEVIPEALTALNAYSIHIERKKTTQIQQLKNM